MSRVSSTYKVHDACPYLSYLAGGGSLGIPPTSEVVLGKDDHGVDFKVFGETSGSYMLWDESADQLKVANGRMAFGTLSSTAQNGVALTATNNEVFEVYADDNNTTLGNAVYSTVRSRTMLFKDASGISLFGIRGQIKCADEVDFATGVFAPVGAYFETMDDTDIQSGAKFWGVDSSIESPANGAVTVDSGGILGGLHAELTGGGQFTQSSGGILAGLYIDEQVTTGKWGYGIYVTGADKQFYGTTTATGSSAVNTVDIVVSDACTQSSGYAHGLHIGLTNSGNKTGAASSSQMNGIGVDYTQSGTFTGGMNGIYVYMDDSGGPTLTSAQAVGGYFDMQEMGQLTTVACLALDKSNTTAGSYADCFIHMVNQGSGATTNALQFHGAGPTFFIATAQVNGCFTVDAGATGDNSTHKIAVNMGGTTGYIAVFADY